MARGPELKTLGIHWGITDIYFCETSGKSPLQFFSLPLPDRELEKAPSLEMSDGGDLIGEKREIHFDLPIKDLLEDHQVLSDNFILSLPTIDIIFRSFVIPWMQPNEIKQAVEFESQKYIPFDLQELLYSFHHFPTSDENNKQIRVIFAAIRKEALDRYTRQFSGADLEPSIIESGSTSIARALMAKNIIRDDESLAVIERDHAHGRITIFNKGVPEFVRDFSLVSPTEEIGKEMGMGTSQDPINSRLAGEVRISLDYFNRQEPDTDITKVIILNGEGDPCNLSEYAEELGVEFHSITTSQILDATVKNTGFVHAYGASLIESSPISIKLLLKESKAVIRRKKKVAVPKGKKMRTSVLTAAICLPFILLTFFTTQIFKVAPRKKVSELNEQLGAFEGVSASKLKEQNDGIQKKLDQYKTIRLDSDINVILSSIPDLLPEGAWLRNMSVFYSDSSESSRRRAYQSTSQEKKEDSVRAVTELTGYVYLEDPKGQIRLIREFLGNLRQNQMLSSLFSNIDLLETKVERLGEYDVTSFSIICR